MDELPETMAGAVHAGLSARAAQTDADAALADAAHMPTKGSCLNCDTPLVGSHCHACGQRGAVHRTLRAFGHDLLHGVLHFEGKLWRTLPGLLWRPGRLTREYIDGKRAKYISPIAFFLFVVFCTYIGFSALAPEVPADFAPPAATVESLQADRAQAAETVAGFEAELEASEDPVIQAGIRGDLEGARAELRTIEGMLAGLESSSADSRETDDTGESEPREPKPLLEGDKLPEGLQRVADNPQLAAYKLQTNAYKFAWALIPLSAPFVWLLLFWKRRFRMYDHVVFVTYSIGFMVALSGISALLVGYFNETGLLLLLYAPFHLYRHLRGTYALSRFSAIWRLFVLSAFIWIVIGMFVMILGISVGT